ncbi:MAG: hypothetical protein E3J40_00855 [Dehalococcoidia bacterium]|nr:MAG: hypothetical protein E3J40_00855 [Dehalococcoidia bacterium]
MSQAEKEPEIELPPELVVPAYANCVSFSRRGGEVVLTFSWRGPKVPHPQTAETADCHKAVQRVLMNTETGEAMVRMLVKHMFSEEVEKSLPRKAKW